MVGARAAQAGSSCLNKIAMLLKVPEFAEMIPTGKKNTFIKTNFSQVGYARHIRPVLIRAIVEAVREIGGKPVVTDTSGFSPKGSFPGDQWFEAAELMGYSEAALNCERVIANGYEGNDGEFVSTGGNELGGVEVARVIVEAECLVVVSHVTAHPLAGYFGALVNIGLECLNNSGKARIHGGLKPTWEEAVCDRCETCFAYCPWGALQGNGTPYLTENLCSGCGMCLLVCPQRAWRLRYEQAATFQRRVAESAAAIVKTLNKKIVYLNFLLDVVPQPDRFFWSDVPFVPDLGFLASTDPVALDAVTVELVRRAPGMPNSAAQEAGVLACGQEKFKALTGVDPLYLLAHAEKMGIGSRRCEVLVAEG